MWNNTGFDRFDGFFKKLGFKKEGDKSYIYYYDRDVPSRHIMVTIDHISDTLDEMLVTHYLDFDYYFDTQISFSIENFENEMMFELKNHYYDKMLNFQRDDKLSSLLRNSA